MSVCQQCGGPITPANKGFNLCFPCAASKIIPSNRAPKQPKPLVKGECQECSNPIYEQIATCWPCYYEHGYSPQDRPKNYPCSLCSKNKRGGARYCDACEAKIYPSEQEIETALVEIREWIS